MSGLSRFSGRIVAASIGLLAAQEAYAVAESRPVPPGIQGWFDPVATPSPYGTGQGGGLSALSRQERLEIETQMEALEDISARLDTVIDDLGFLASDLIEQFLSSEAPGAKVAFELRETIERFRRERDGYVSPSRGRIAPATYAPGHDFGVAPEENDLDAMREYVMAQEGLLKSLKTAIQSVYAFEGTDVAAAMAPLEEAAAEWMSLSGYVASATPVGTAPQR
jgi:hypothetical protein